MDPAVHAALFAHFADGAAARRPKRSHDEALGQDDAQTPASADAHVDKRRAASSDAGPAPVPVPVAPVPAAAAPAPAAPAPVPVQAPTRAARQRYHLGQHGAKRREQQRLTAAHDFTVNGKTHESEHAIGFAPLNDSSDEKRGGSSEARVFENIAPAYQEVKELHAAHIGTGNRGEVDGSGFNASSYRETQRALLEAGRPGDAVQINQLAYAHLPDTPGTGTGIDPAHQAAARDSYRLMVRNMDEVTIADGGARRQLPVSSTQRLEMLASEWTRAHKRYPSFDQLNALRAELDMPTHDAAVVEPKSPPAE